MAETNIIAHRGNSSVAPENTLASVRAAVNLTPQPAYIEIDLHRSSDGVLVVSHDEDTLRTTGVAGMIREQKFSVLRKLDAGYSKQFGDKFKGERLPRLEEVLDLVKDTPIGIMIESKQLLLEDDVVALLNKRGEIEKHVFASFDELSVFRAKELAPKLRTLFLAGELSQGSLLRGKDVKADIMGVSSKTSETMIRQARQKGFQVWVWTVDDEKDMKNFFQVPVDGLISNRPEQALKLLNSQ
ncbi:MAG: glycerophosphodiester phosphodiesterase family protein [Candidatus Hinthialibacter antarcticus]|nr:glycerophosphodiester phosphodiesterase family protein [Candidatus Hinthialibacter antarcticus]